MLYRDIPIKYPKPRLIAISSDGQLLQALGKADSHEILGTLEYGTLSEEMLVVEKIPPDFRRILPIPSIDLNRVGEQWQWLDAD